jgi:hypothetical protein
MSRTFDCSRCFTTIEPTEPTNNGESRQVKCRKCGKSYSLKFEVIMDDRDGIPQKVDWVISRIRPAA